MSKMKLIDKNKAISKILSQMTIARPDLGRKLSKKDYIVNQLLKTVALGLAREETVNAIPVDWIITKAQEYLIDMRITGWEMRFIKNLIEEWENEIN